VTSITGFNILLKTLGFTYLNPHVYSDTVFFLGNFSKNFIISQKILFGIGASIASFLFFFLIGYLSKYLSKYATKQKVWNVINILIIIFMSFLTLFIITKMIN
jgi:L-lysine exporter family protein LysE/ArgO